MHKLMIALMSLMSLVSASPALADDPSVVRWSSIVGVITAQNVDNPVGNIHSGTFAWSARRGSARVNLSTGAASFEVEGLVINGTPFSGTPGPITAVTGTLVCNAGSMMQVFDTPAVSLDAQGDAEFSGSLSGVPAQCPNPLFLIRIGTPAAAAHLWIATGAGRSTGDHR